MLLEDAESKEQVAEALADGDLELRKDIEEILDAARVKWERNDGNAESDEDGYDDVLTDEEFVDLVIQRSPVNADLRQIPEEFIVDTLKEMTPGGVFLVGPEKGYLNHKIERKLGYGFAGRWFGRNPNLRFVPANIAEDFWDSLRDDNGKAGTIVWDNKYEINPEPYYVNSGIGPGQPYYITTDRWEFDEWCVDVIAEYMQGVAKADPAKARELFWSGLEDEDKALAKELRSFNRPDDEILDFATQWFQSRSDTIEAIESHLENLRFGQDEDNVVVATFSRADIAQMGITKGTLLEEAPWKLIKLWPAQLAMEGVTMGHCVGKKDMGYIQAVKDGEIEIWSLRSRGNKPRFTLEVDEKFHSDDMDPGTPEQVARWLREKRGRAIKQLKGKGNRTPGFADSHQRGGVKFPDEVIFWENALAQLGVEPSQVRDFEALKTRTVVPNGDSCTGFDMPYRRLAPNKRASHRRSRRSSKRASRRTTSRRRR